MCYLFPMYNKTCDIILVLKTLVLAINGYLQTPLHCLLLNKPQTMHLIYGKKGC